MFLAKLPAQNRFLIVRVLVPNVADERVGVLVPPFEMRPCQSHQLMRHIDANNLNVLFSYISDAPVLDPAVLKSAPATRGDIVKRQINYVQDMVEALLSSFR